MQEKIIKFSRGFAELWFVGITVMPWVLFSIFLMLLSYSIGSIIFNFLFSIIGIFGIFYLAYVVFIKQKTYSLDPARSFILSKSSKVFWTGIVSTYALGVLIFFLSPFMGIFVIFGASIMAVPIIVLYYLGKKSYQKFQENLPKT